MKCRDCEHWGWGDDEGTHVWGLCWIRTSCQDPDIERTCPDFSPKAPDIFTALSTLQAENEKLRNEVERQRRSADDRKHLYENAERAYMKVVAELEQVKRERAAAVESIPHECKTCVYHTVFFNGCTLDHDCTNPDGGCSNNYDRWRWRGPHKED